MTSNVLLTRIPVPVRLGVPLALALLLAACGGSGSPASAGGKPTGGSAGTVITTHAGTAGPFLTDGAGRAVYLWVKDGTNRSACSGACAGAWPPVKATGAVTASGGANAGDLGTITRSDGTKQVTYAGHPLYYFAGDSGSGQTNGQGSSSFGAKWWLVAPSGTGITGAESASNSPAPSASASKAGSTGGGWA